MKTLKPILTVLALIITFSLSAQQGINYKALIKDSGGNVVANDLIAIQFTILQGAGMVNVYQETHTPTTDDNGIIVVNIGEGAVNSGVYADIDWGIDDHFLNVQIDTGGGLTDMGTTQFMAVPYALHASTASLKVNDLLDGKSDNDGSSIFLGMATGLNDDSSDNQNVGIGFQALQNNTSGYGNTATGHSALYSNTSGIRNTATGRAALYANSTGNNNTAMGREALYNNTIGDYNLAMGNVALYSNNEGYENIAIGRAALYSNTTGFQNTAFGFEALMNNDTGANNVASGNQALYSNTFGTRNVATGNQALYSNTTGFNNVATGYAALFFNTTGINNVATGLYALRSNTTGSYNVASGSLALYSNTTGNNNVASGIQALNSNTTGNNNVATGYMAMYSNTDGHENIASGNYALTSNTTGNFNTAIGSAALYSNTTGFRNTAVGRSALSNNTTGSYNIAIGAFAEIPDPTGSFQVRIGNESIGYAGIQVPWDVTSDMIWKENIRELPYGLELVKQLKPVDYIRKNNEHKTREIGFIGQDVETLLAKIGYTDQGILHKDDKGYISLRYNDFIAILTKAIQEQQDIIDHQNEKIESQDRNYEALLKRVEQLEFASNK